jgi:hypothetical protein
MRKPMNDSLRAIELDGIILFPGETGSDEKEWLATAASNPAFDFLKDQKEEIYSISDGKPFHDQS